ncbi:DUF5317 domain-containing protein [Alkaliphilus sp. MSJ-5]|uniref:DUF5317 domain-containing protein n=1 Tax=Alkaliphilus flagellatus TaxID=2841507 RepID=A0ABS6G2J0_9FIRM|nr:DUF5317 domain-containing protein [Alkaliphilus flagellatus]MBU5676700.1 DUF5317 domain-containing protein [Alkaliphilus flagellatus]
MIFEGLILGIIVGKLRGGNVRNLGKFMFKSSFLLVFSLILQLGTSILISIGYEKAVDNRMFIYIVAYIMLFIVLFLNLGRGSVWFILVGAIANFAAIVLNEGSMPIDIALLEKMGFENMLQSIKIGAMPNYIDINEAYSFTIYLAKRFATPIWYPFKQIFSAGDIAISLGLLLFTQGIMQLNRHHYPSKILKFDYRGKMKF